MKAAASRGVDLWSSATAWWKPAWDGSESNRTNLQRAERPQQPPHGWGQPLLQVAPNSCCASSVCHGDSRAYRAAQNLQGLQLCCLRRNSAMKSRRNPARKSCAGGSLWCREKPAWESWARSADLPPTKWSCTTRTRCSNLQNASATTSPFAGSPNA